MSRIVLAHTPRHPPPWLIFDVSQNMKLRALAVQLTVMTALAAEPSRVAVIRGWIFDVPTSFVEKTHDGPDFTVTYFSAPEGKASLGIYEGMHPQRFSEDHASVREEKDQIGGQSVQWTLWEEERDGSAVFRAETFLVIDPKAKHVEKFHVFAFATSSADLDILRRIARSARAQANRVPVTD